MDVDYLIIHHVGDVPAGFPAEDPVPTIRDWHVNGRGWADIAYHKLITPSGKIKQGRADAVIGAHAFGANAHSLGILMVGDFRKVPPGDAQMNALVQVCAILCKRHGIDPKKIIGHRDVAKLFPGGAASDCPGDALYKLLPEVRRRVGDYLG